MSDLISQLRALARAQHMDLSIADEAADEIEELRAADLDAIGKRGERLAKALLAKAKAEKERDEAQDLLRVCHLLTSIQSIDAWTRQAAPHIEAARRRREEGNHE